MTAAARKSPIATEKVFGQRPGEERFEIVIEIGKPYRVAGAPNEWACAVALIGLDGRLPDVHGEGSLQALSLAIGLAYRLLQFFEEDGGVLTDAQGDRFALDAVFGRRSASTLPAG